jgi:hypothetical protein
MLDLSKRVFMAIENQTPTNCIGTALFLSGVNDSDEYFSPPQAKRHFLPRMESLSQPEEGAIISWENDATVNHMGVVVSVNPLKVTHRLGCYSGGNAIIVEGDDFQRVDERYGSIDFTGEQKFTIRYYRPIKSP